MTSEISYFCPSSASRGVAARILIALLIAQVSLVFATRTAMAADVILEWDHKVPLRDGVRLSATIYKPREQAAPLPCVVAFSSYPVDYIAHAGLEFAGRGYVFVAVNARGRADSEGTFHFARGVGDDGYDIVEHVGTLPACDGRVVMWGGSWLANSQWATAAKQPPHLRAIVPLAASRWDWTRWFGLNGVRFRVFPLSWLVMVSGRADNFSLAEDKGFWRSLDDAFLRSGKSLAELPDVLGYRPAMWDEMMSYGPYDPRVRAFSPVDAELTRMSVPVLNVTGYYDALQPGALWLADRRQQLGVNGADASWIVTGPFTHEDSRLPKRSVGGVEMGEAVVVDFVKVSCEWFDHLLKGGPLPKLLSDHFVYYLVGANRWIGAPSVAAATAPEVRLWLEPSAQPSSPGRLSSSAHTVSNTIPIISDPRRLPFRFAPDEPFLASQRLEQEADDSVAVFEGAPVAEDTDFVGRSHLALWLKSNVPDADIFYQVKAVRTDGSAALVTGGVTRLRFRSGTEHAEPVPIGRAFPVDIRFSNFAAYRLFRGDHLRLIVMTGPKLDFERNMNDGGETRFEGLERARVGRLDLLTGGDHASAFFPNLRAAQ